ncbi:MAG: hypothetical protein CMJ83_08435 [Planctomycetes bacterium]|nr:hypothetical protein [Planctomycetota bacterium]
MRAWLVDVYKVVEQSMWPTFQGGTDRILVQRFGPGPRRWEIWLYRNEEAGERPSVKRVIGIEGEYVDFRMGDLYVGNTATSLSRSRPPPEVLDALLVPVYPTAWGKSGKTRFNVLPDASRLSCDGPGLRFDASGVGSAGVTASLITGQGTTREGIYDDSIDNHGQWTPGRHKVPDIRIDLIVEDVEGGGTLRIVHELEGGREDRLVAIGLGRLRLLRGRDGRGGYRILPWGGTFPLALRMETIDGRFRVVRRDAETGAEVAVLVEEHRDTAAHHGYSRVRFRLDRGGARLSNLSVRRDIYWTWPPHHGGSGPYHVDHGVFMVGDNPSVSQDSRHQGPIADDRLLGWARVLLWPKNRFRTLP